MVNVILEIAKKEIKTFFRQSRAGATFVMLLIFASISIFEIQHILSQSGYTATALSSALGSFLFLASVFPATLAGGICFMAFAAERDQKTLEHLLSMPLSDNEIFLGKFLAAVIAGLAGLLLVFSVVVGYAVFSNPIVWNAPLLTSSLSLLAFVLSPMIVILFALISTVLSRYLSSRDSFITNLASVGVLLGIFALKETVTMDALAFNAILAVIISATVVTLYVFGARKFNRESLVSRL
jgi:ABC-2 type transport system permease protein